MQKSSISLSGIKLRVELDTAFSEHISSDELHTSLESSTLEEILFQSTLSSVLELQQISVSSAQIFSIVIK